MKVSEIKKRAKSLGVKVAKRKKAELIRAVQEAEGNFPCFGTAQGYCEQQDCCWRDDCLK